jgi:hypothetical protein
VVAAFWLITALALAVGRYLGALRLGQPAA